MILERIKFYADTPRNEKNKRFCFDCTIFKLEDCIYRFFLQGWFLRAAWYEKIDQDTGEVIENIRINDLQSYYEKALDLPKHEKDRILGVSFTKENNLK